MKVEENSSSHPVNENKVVSSKGNSKSLMITLILFLVIGVVFYSLYRREHKQLLNLMETQKNSLTETITARDSVINEWISTFDEIEKNLTMIKEKEKIITVNSSDVEFSKDKKELILEDIKYINSLLDQNKKKIASLNAQLKKSGGTIKALQGKIAELEASMRQSETEISDLKTTLTEKDFEIEQLNAEMTDLQITLVQKEEKIVNQTSELNKGYIASGTFKELKEKGLVTKEGGFIGLGRKKSLIENFPDSVFTQINITELGSIPVNSKDARFITEHPVGSYEFIKRNNIVESIEIKDPIQFWKISRYAVVELVK
jgi:hypothetical protein